jgi:hypothetical protein
MITLRFLANAKDSSYNRDLVQFLNDNLRDITQRNIKISHKIVEDSENDKLMALGITELPSAMIYSKTERGKPLNGPMAVKSYLMKASSRKAVVKQSKSAEDEMREYYESEMNTDAMEKDQDETGGNESVMTEALKKANDYAASRMQMFAKEKTKSGFGGGKTKKRESNITVASPATGSISEDIKSSSDGSKDDDMWASKFEESVY